MVPAQQAWEAKQGEVNMSNGLRAIIRRVLIEQEVALAQDSLDDQIDSILLRFESDSIIGDQETAPPITGEGLIDLRSLLEAPEDEEEPEEDPDADEPPADDEAEPEHDDQAQDPTPDAESEPMHPDLDVSKFALKVVRLITSYQNLLDIPTVIATRAYNYLVTNYDQAIADAYKEVLSSQGIELDEPATSEPETLPIAVGAGASGLGGP